MNIKTLLLLPLALCAASTQIDAKSITASEAMTAAQSLAEKIGDNPDALVLASPDNAPYYIFSRGAGQGYIIVSGDDRTTEILGYTDSGDYDYDKLPNPLREMLDSWAEKIKRLQTVPDTETAVQKSAARRAVDAFKKNWTSVEPLVKTHWHQSNPYNIYSPMGSDENGSYKSITGCVATAASQIIYYYRKDNPDTTLYDTPTYSYGAPVTVSIPKGTPILYDIMLLQGTGTAKQDSAVALLNYVIGTSSYLTYGRSTSGQAYQAGSALDGQFSLKNNMVYKESYDQTSWENLVYRNLSSNRPLLYTGVNESQGGHAVVLDGYQASTGLYHFNFGWGGQGDGYYTVNDETGMNGFNTYQSAVEWITPKKQNLTGSIAEIAHMYQRTNNDISVTVSNKGTLAYSGVYIYIGTSKTLPTGATFVDSENEIPAGSSMTFTTQYRPTTNRKVYVYLCDDSRRILDSCSVEVEPTVADLHLNSIKVDAGTTLVDIDGMQLPRVNNTTANISVALTNGENGSFCQPTFKCVLEKYDTDTKAWTEEETKICSSIQFNVGERRDTVFTFDGLSEGVGYRAYIDKTARTSERSEVIYDTPDSIVCFTAMKPDMTYTAEGRKATIGGTWNATVFESLATDSTVTAYDMTAVTELNSQPSVPARNAVFVANAAFDGAKNIVSADGECDSLVIAAGYDYAPLMEIKAKKAILLLPEDDEPGKWNDVMIPFDATVPSGMQVRMVDSIASSRVELTNVSEIAAFTPVLYLKDRLSLTAITATDVVVSADTVATTLEGRFISTTVSTITDGTQYLLGENSSGVPTYLKADAGTTVSPFATVLYGTGRNGHRALKTTTIDVAYMHLADSLARAYDVLSDNRDYRSADIVAEFEAAIAKAETYFNAATAENASEVNDVSGELSAAIVAFLNGISTGIETVTTEASTATSAPLEIYDLNGRKLNNTSSLSRGLYIIKRGNTTKKVFVK